MAKNPVTYYFVVLHSDLEKRGLTALLEMLRYDRAVVELETGNAVVLSSHKPPTEGRWSSFGIPIIYQDFDPKGWLLPYDVGHAARAENGYREG